jgi:hypothetical protein
MSARTIDTLRVGMQAAVAHHMTRRHARLARAAAWDRAADAYQRCAPFASMHASRAEALAIAAKRRALAWQALADMDAHHASLHRAQSLTARRMCGTLTARVWGGRA